MLRRSDLDQVAINTIRSLAIDAMPKGPLRPSRHADGRHADGMNRRT